MIPRGCELAGETNKEHKYWFFGFHTFKGPTKILAPYTAEMGDAEKACRIGNSGKGNLILSRNSAQCAEDPRFPHLESGKGQRGDVCRMDGFGTTTWACPKGCVAVIKNEHESKQAYEESGFCLERDGGGMCRKKKCVPEWKPLFSKLEDNSKNERLGNRCLSEKDMEVSFIVPKGCKATSLDGTSLKLPLTEIVGKHHSGGPCRPQVPTHDHPKAHWKLVASSTHDINVGVTIGISQANETEKGKEESLAGAVEVGMSASIEGPGGGGRSFEASREYELGQAVFESIESTKGMSRERRVEISCPDGTRPRDRFTSNPLSVNTEYVYQWVVQSDKMSIQTEHFRCHQTGGDEVKPECPPTLCGEPKENPYCSYSFNKCEGDKKAAQLKPKSKKPSKNPKDHSDDDNLLGS
jgi:hypothetical protein